MTEQGYFEQFVGDVPDDVSHRVVTRQISHRNVWLRICERWNSDDGVWVVSFVDYSAVGNDPDRSISIMKALEAWDDLMTINRILNIGKE